MLVSAGFTNSNITDISEDIVMFPNKRWYSTGYQNSTINGRALSRVPQPVASTLRKALYDHISIPFSSSSSLLLMPLLSKYIFVVATKPRQA